MDTFPSPRMRETLCQPGIWQGIQIQNIQKTQIKHPESKQLNLKMCGWTEFSKEEIQVNKKYFKQCSTSLAIRGMQIKFLWNPILSLSEWLSSRIQMTTNVRVGMEKRACSLVDMEKTGAVTVEISVQVSQWVKNRTTIVANHPTLEHTQRFYILPQRYLLICIYCCPINNSKGRESA